MSDAIFALAHQLRTGDFVLGVAVFLVVTWGLCGALLLLHRLPAGGWASRYSRFAWQLGALLSLEQAYEFTRGQIPHENDVAFLNAYRVLDFEWRHGFFVESRIQHFFLHFHALMNTIDVFYVFSHAFVTVGLLLWVYMKRREHYPFVRNLFIVATGIALVAFYVYPTAPPRMLANYGLTDPAVTHHLIGEGGAQPGSYTYNPYAAMPSLHVTYAIIVAWALLLAERKVWLRGLAVLYPMAMTAAVIISGNHWVLDVAGAVVTVAAAGTLIFGVSWLHAVGIQLGRQLYAGFVSPQPAENVIDRP